MIVMIVMIIVMIIIMVMVDDGGYDSIPSVGLCGGCSSCDDSGGGVMLMMMKKVMLLLLVLSKTMVLTLFQAGSGHVVFDIMFNDTNKTNAVN